MNWRKLRRHAIPLAMVGLVVLTQGCAVGALVALMSPGSGYSTAAGEPPLRALTVRGVLKVPAEFAAKGSLSAAPALGVANPFTDVAPSSRIIQGLRILATEPQASSGTEWNADGTVRFAHVDLVNPVTGEVVGTGVTDGTGYFVVQTTTPAANRVPLLAQAVLRNSAGETAGVLAAPFGAAVTSVPTRQAGVEVSVGSTLLTFSTLLLSDQYDKVDLREGFKGVKSVRLGTLVSAMSSDRTSTAASVLSRNPDLGALPGFDALVSKIASESAELSYHIQDITNRAANNSPLTPDGEVSFASAAMDSLLGAIIRLDADAQASGSATTNLFQGAASQVDLTTVKQQADDIQRGIGPSPVPTLPPIPTPTPGNIGVVVH